MEPKNFMLLDLIGAATSFASTYYFIRLSSKAWLISLLAIAMNGYLYWQKGIYADTMLEFFYFLSTCYGLFLWQQPQKHSIEIKRLSQQQTIWLIILFLTIFTSTATLLYAFTDSQVIFMDSLTASLSIVAQLLMCQKILATWFFWCLTDFLYAYLYFSKNLPFHALLMIVYIGLAVIGYLTWSKKMPQFTTKEL